MRNSFFDQSLDAGAIRRRVQELSNGKVGFGLTFQPLTLPILLRSLGMHSITGIDIVVKNLELFLRNNEIGHIGKT